MSFFTGLAKCAGTYIGMNVGGYAAMKLAGVSKESALERVSNGEMACTGTQAVVMVGGTVVGGIAGYYATDAIINALSSGNGAPVMTYDAAPLAAMPSVV